MCARLEIEDTEGVPMMLVRLELDDTGIPERIDEAATIAMVFGRYTMMNVAFRFNGVECVVKLGETGVPCVKRYEKYCREHPEEFPR